MVAPYLKITCAIIMHTHTHARRQAGAPVREQSPQPLLPDAGSLCPGAEVNRGQQRSTEVCSDAWRYVVRSDWLFAIQCYCQTLDVAHRMCVDTLRTRRHPGPGSLNSPCSLRPPNGGRAFLMSPPPVWNFRAVILIPLFYISSLVLLFCLVLSLFLSYPFLLLTHSPDLHFPKGMLFCVALVLFLEWLGDEYFSWGYMQYMLP